MVRYRPRPLCQSVLIPILERVCQPALQPRKVDQVPSFACLHLCGLELLNYFQLACWMMCGHMSQLLLKMQSQVARSPSTPCRVNLKAANNTIQPPRSSSPQRKLAYASGKLLYRYPGSVGARTSVLSVLIDAPNNSYPVQRSSKQR